MLSAHARKDASVKKCLYGSRQAVIALALRGKKANSAPSPAYPRYTLESPLDRANPVFTGLAGVLMK